MATAHPTAGGSASNNVHDLIAAEHAAWKAVGDREKETLAATGYDHEAARVERAREATAAVLKARPTDLPSMAALLRWIVTEGGGCAEGEETDQIVLHIAEQLVAAA